MSFADLVGAQLIDPFRIGLVVALVFTMMRTRAQSGTLIPLAAGVIFVSAILPSTIGAGLAAPFWSQFGAGLISTSILVAIVLGIWQLVERLRR